MGNELIFDAPASQRFVEARQSTLRPFLRSIREASELHSAVDAGCGVGYFSAFLADLGFDVVGFDGRPENVEEAKRRYPKIEFHVANVEDSSVLQLGSFDLVLCVGLLYHLENPLRALRNLAAMTKQFLLVESYATPHKENVFFLREELHQEDQSLTSLALYPSETSLVKFCYKIGFSSVFRFLPLPDHQDFQDRAGRARQRTMLLAAKSALCSPQVSLLPEPQDFSDPWQTKIGGFIGFARRFMHSLDVRKNGRKSIVSQDVGH